MAVENLKFVARKNRSEIREEFVARKERSVFRESDITYG
jgi:hypothetical protein